MVDVAFQHSTPSPTDVRAEPLLAEANEQLTSKLQFVGWGEKAAGN